MLTLSGPPTAGTVGLVLSRVYQFERLIFMVWQSTRCIAALAPVFEVEWAASPGSPVKVLRTTQGPHYERLLLEPNSHLT